MSRWIQRIRPPTSPPELQQVRAAAQDLAQQAHHAPGKARLVFQTVADVSIISTAVISGALAAVGLYKALFPPHRYKEARPVTDPSGNDRSPPSRRLAMAAGDEPNGRGR